MHPLIIFGGVALLGAFAVSITTGSQDAAGLIGIVGALLIIAGLLKGKR